MDTLVLTKGEYDYFKRNGEIITLHLKKEYFFQIMCFKKRNEYRNVKYKKQLEGKRFVEFAWGYPTRSEVNKWMMFEIKDVKTQETRPIELQNFAALHFPCLDIVLGRKVVILNWK